MAVNTTIEKGSPCPNCGNPFTKRDVLRRVSSRSFLPILIGCDVCKSVWEEGSPAGEQSGR